MAILDKLIGGLLIFFAIAFAISQILIAGLMIWAWIVSDEAGLAWGVVGWMVGLGVVLLISFGLFQMGMRRWKTEP